MSNRFTRCYSSFGVVSILIEEILVLPKTIANWVLLVATELACKKETAQKNFQSCLRSYANLCCRRENQNKREGLLVNLEVATYYATWEIFETHHQAKGRSIVDQICAIYLLRENVCGKSTKLSDL